MFDHGYLCPVKYQLNDSYDSKKIKNNTTGQGFNENALLEYNEKQDIVSKIVNTVAKSEAKHILIFTQFRVESEQVIAGLAARDIICKEISGVTKKKERTAILAEFRTGKICVVNVGTLTTGYDFPELDHVVFAKPTKSLRLFSQICGRGLRIAAGKDFCSITDLCDNVKRFGEINSFVIEDPSGKELWRLKSNQGYLTGVNLISGKDLELKRKKTTKKEKKQAETGEIVIPFGKFKNKKLCDLETGYLEWVAKNFDKGKWKNIFTQEIARRA